MPHLPRRRRGKPFLTTARALSTAELRERSQGSRVRVERAVLVAASPGASTCSRLRSRERRARDCPRSSVVNAERSWGNGLKRSASAGVAQIVRALCWVRVDSERRDRVRFSTRSRIRVSSMGRSRLMSSDARDRRVRARPRRRVVHVHHRRGARAAKGFSSRAAIGKSRGLCPSIPPRKISKRETSL